MEHGIVRAPRSDSFYTLPINVSSGPAPEIGASLGAGLPAVTYSRGEPPDVNGSVSYYYACVPDPVFHLARLRRGHVLFTRCPRGESIKPGLSVRCADLESMNRALSEFEKYAADHPDVSMSLGPWDSADDVVEEFRFLGGFMNEIHEAKADVTSKNYGRIVKVATSGSCMIDDHWPDSKVGDTLWVVVCKDTEQAHAPWMFKPAFTSPSTCLPPKYFYFVDPISNSKSRAAAIRIGTKGELRALDGTSEVFIRL